MTFDRIAKKNDFLDHTKTKVTFQRTGDDTSNLSQMLNESNITSLYNSHRLYNFTRNNHIALKSNSTNLLNTTAKMK